MGVLNAKVGTEWVPISASTGIPPWIILPLSGSWVAENDNGFTAPAYRKVGDLVYIRGSCMLTASSFLAANFGPLPVGYRPPTSLRTMMGAHKRNVGGVWRVRGAIMTDGTVSLAEFSGTDPANPVVYLDDIKPFSVTA